MREANRASAWCWQWCWKEVTLPGLCVIFLVLIARSAGLFQEQEWRAFDQFLRHRPSEEKSDRLVIVGINEQDLAQIGGFPVPDDILATVLTSLQEAEPRVIGIDLFRDLTTSSNRGPLTQVLKSHPNIVGIDVVLNADDMLNVPPPPELPPEQIGFADALIDPDGKLRRFPLASRTWRGDLRYSFALTLARIYLSAEGYLFRQGSCTHCPKDSPHSSDPIFFSSDTRQANPLIGLKANTGGYINTDANGHQLLINFCTHPDCYPVLSLSEVFNQRFDPELVRDRIVLIGMTAPSVKDTFVSAAIPQTLFSKHLSLANTANRNVYGIELHAHVLHHLLGHVLAQRTSWRSLPDGLEYLWIGVWGVGGISIGLVVRSPWRTLLGICGLTIALVSSCYVLILGGWWLPVVPTVFSIVAAGLTTAFFDRDLRLLAEQRRLTIEQTFEAVHNGPLQSLAVLSREVKSGEACAHELAHQLDSLNQELRELYAKMESAAIEGSDRLYLSNNLILDVRNPLPELLNQIFTHTLARSFPGFETLKFCITPDFSPLDNCLLSTIQKRGLCLFFEEALCNVGKHALKATRLEVRCSYTETEYHLSISDNSPTHSFKQQRPSHIGQGTKQAEELAQILRGRFRRSPNKRQGTKCELTWPTAQNSTKLIFKIKSKITQNKHKDR